MVTVVLEANVVHRLVSGKSVRRSSRADGTEGLTHELDGILEAYCNRLSAGYHSATCIWTIVTSDEICSILNVGAERWALGLASESPAASEEAFDFIRGDTNILTVSIVKRVLQILPEEPDRSLEST